MTWRVLSGLMLLLLIVVGLAIAEARRGGLDRSFGGDGRVTTNIDRSALTRGGIASDVVKDDKGRVVVAGSGTNAHLTIARFNRDGSLDTTFDDDGLLEPEFGSQIAVTDGGSVIVAGTIGRGNPGADLGLRRYLPDGRIDRLFGRNGTVRTDLDLREEVQDLFVQPSGHLAVFGYGRCHGSERGCGYTYEIAALTRYSPGGKVVRSTKADAERFIDVSMSGDGSFSASAFNFDAEHRVLLRFGSDGRLVGREEFGYGAPFGPHLVGRQQDGRIVARNWQNGLFVRLQNDDRSIDSSFESSRPPCRSTHESFGELLVQPDDRILVSGVCGLVRLEKDGRADASFGSGGLVDVDLGHPAPMSLQDDGSILAANWDYQLGGLRVFRYQSDGQPSAGFGAGGRVELPLTAPTTDTAEAVTMTRDGRVLAAGSSHCVGSPCGGFAIARYLSNGRLDRSFGGDGTVLTEGEGLGRALAIATYANGSVIAAGRTTQRTDSSGQTVPRAFALAKYLPTGELDSSFGRLGIVTTQASTDPQGRSEITDVALQPDGRIVVAGLAEGCPDLCFTVARYLRDGTLDPGFGDGGFFRRHIKGPSGALARAVAIQPDGRIVATGGSYDNYVTVRLRPSGKLDRSFGGDGIVVTKIRPGRSANSIVLGQHGSITIGGGSISARGLIVRYRRDGHIDRRFGSSGRVRIPTLGVTDIGLTSCGLVVVGTVSTGPERSSLGVVGLPRRRLRRGGQARIRRPFGSARDSFGNELAISRSPTKAVAAGRFDPRLRSGDFALARYRADALTPDCRSGRQ